MLEELGRYYERALTLPPEAKPIAGPSGRLDRGEHWLTPELDELLGISDDAAAALGRCTAALHLALHAPTSDPVFAPEPLTAADLAELVNEVQGHAASVFELLKEALPQLPDDLVEMASRVLSQRTRSLARLKRLADLNPDSDRIRIHGDYHLGQVLRVGQEFVVLDFEGEPARTLAERRAKQPALKDLAGMLRSFSYAARVALQTHLARRPGDPERLEPWARLWEQSVSAVFMNAYLREVGETRILPAVPAELDQLLDAYVLDKALYELRYELGNRPAWVRVPLADILDLVADQP
jgi:maltose alpha-D-glucosyltransferase/alpha-amylase